MQLKQELIIRLFLTLGLVFIVGKVIATLLASFKERRSSKGSYKDLDSMIERQKNMLRFEQGINARNASPAPAATTGDKKSKTKNAYLKGDAQVAKWIDGLQWGGGDDFAFIVQRLNQELGVEIRAEIVGQTFLGMVNRDFLLGFNPLPNNDQVAKMLELKSLIDFTLDEFKSDKDGGPAVEALARRKNVSVWEMARAVEMHFLQGEMKGAVLLRHVITKPGQLKNMAPGKRQEMVWAELKSGTSPAGLSIFVSRLEKQLPKLQPFTPLPPMRDKYDVEGALRIFGFEQNPGDEVLKKTYKKLASIRHPDRLAGQEVDDELMRIANDLFSRVQSAWDLLKK